ncbi:MAG: hypothetical protein PHU51_02575 [Candidatus Nanoarchaeia archaeon]|nr:hypothetical protein [Candidatus Nanoarchaeia archaeon]
MVIEINNTAIKNYFIEVHKSNEGYIEFVNKLSEFDCFLNSLPTEINNAMMPIEEWQLLSMTNFDKAYEIVRNEANTNINFSWILSSFKLRQLFKSIIHLLNESHYYALVSLLRTFLEVVSYNAFMCDKINELVIQLNNSTNNYFQYCELNTDLENLVKKSRKGTKITKLLEEGESFVENTNILTTLDKISKKEKYKTLRDKYDLLSEIVHPNVMSNFIFGLPTKLNDPKEDKTFEKERIILMKGEMEQYYYEMPEPYSLQISMYFGTILSVLNLSIDLYYETLDKFKQINVLKLEAKLPYYDLLEKLDETKRKELCEQILKSYRNSKKS